VGVVASGAALVGGVALVAHLFVGVAALAWVGLGLVGIAVAVLGAGLARAWWLALLTGLGALALGWALLEVVRDVASDREVDAVVGGLATLGVAVAVLRSSRRPGPAASGAGHPGNHRS
jgi:hypothetical protein